MAVGTWPAGFPCLLRENYGYQQPDLNQRTSFVLGSRIRPLFADGSDDFANTAVILTLVQWAYFQGWYRYAIHNGSDWFTVDILAAGIKTSREVRLTAPPSFQLAGANHVRVSLPLETRTGTTMSQAEWDALNP